jgi:hypothetical protein
VIDALIAGRLCGVPVARTTKAGKPFCTGKIRASTRDGGTVFANIIAFAELPVTSLLALPDGASVALAGELTAGAFTDKEGVPRPTLDLVVHSAVSEYHVARRRKAVRGPDPEVPPLPFDELPGAA